MSVYINFVSKESYFDHRILVHILPIGTQNVYIDEKRNKKAIWRVKYKLLQSYFKT